MWHLSQRFITEICLVLWSVCIYKSLVEFFFGHSRFITPWYSRTIRGVGSFVKQVHRLKQEISALIPEIILSLKGYDNEACAGGFILTVLYPLSSSIAFMFDQDLNASICEHENRFNLTS